MPRSRSTSSPAPPVSRPLVGVIALVCLVVAVAMRFSSTENELWTGAFMRVGLVMGALWLAIPSGPEQGAWARLTTRNLFALILVVILTARLRWMTIPFLIVIGILAIFLRPRKR